MDNDDLENQLEVLRHKIPKEEFVEILLSRLEQNPTTEVRDTLQVWLQAHGHHDERVINYWKQILYGDEPWQRERATDYLFIMCETGNALAREILREYLGEEPSVEVIKKRHFRHLGLE